MKNMLLLEDLRSMSEDEVRSHLIGEYEAPSDLVNELDILIAYESVGSWGCDSSSFFLLKNKETGVLYETHGSHCSCYGFEGQFNLEETSVEALKFRVENAKSVFYVGGYDNNDEENIKAVHDYILAM
jgi:hypothetical protein